MRNTTQHFGLVPDGKGAHNLHHLNCPCGIWNTGVGRIPLPLEEGAATNCYDCGARVQPEELWQILCANRHPEDTTIGQLFELAQLPHLSTDGVECQRFFPILTYQCNFGYTTLKNATWTPYSRENQYNRGDNNGFIIGEVVEGSTTNRLLGHLSTTHKVAGTLECLDWCVNTRIRKVEEGRYHIDRTSCG
jgi:hypothetical protein